MRSKILVFLIGLIICASCEFKSAEAYYEEAAMLSDRAEWEASITLLDKAIEKNSKYRIALLERGFIKAFRLDNYQAGIDDFQKILAFDPDNALALYYTGVLYGGLSENKKAVEYLTKTLKTNNITRVSKLRFDMSSLATNYEDESFFKADGVDVYYQRAIHYMRIEEYDKGIADLTKLIENDLFSKESYFMIAQAYLEKKDTLSACQNFKNSAKFGNKRAFEMVKMYCEKKKVSYD